MNAVVAPMKKLAVLALWGVVALVALAVGASSSLAATNAKKDKGVLGAIHAEKRAGKIDEGRAALYRLWAATDHKKLPPHIRSAHQAERGARGEPSEIRCGTPIVIDVLSKLHLMDSATRKLAQESLPDFATLAPSKKTSSASASSGTAAAKTRPVFPLPNLYETPNFIFGWFNDLTNEDGSLLVMPDDYTDGVPNVVLAWAKYFERSFEVITGEMGFSDAGFGGQKLPVAISSPTAFAPYDQIGYGTYGFTYPTSPPYFLLNYDYSFITDLELFNDDPDGDLRGAMKVTAAHELLHAFHFNYMPNPADPESWIIPDGAWWMEATATWIEDYVFAQVNDYVNYLYYEDPNGVNPPLGWFVDPEWTVAVAVDSPEWNNGRQYGDAIFVKYLSEHLAGPSTVLESWNSISLGALPLSALDTLASGTVSGWTTEDLYLGFSGANATLDYEDKSKYLSVMPPDSFVRSATLSVDSVSDALFVPEYLGATYLKQDGLTGGVQTFEYTTTVSSLADWGLALVHLPDGAGYSVVLAGRYPQSLTLANAGASDVLYGVPSYLDSGGVPSVSFVTLHTDGAASPPGLNTTGPNAITLAPVNLTTVAPATIKVDWTPATDPDTDAIGGYVIQYKLTTEPDWANAASRTIYGDNSQAWLGSLEGDLVGGEDYDVRVAAYDTYGNMGVFSNVLSKAAGAVWPATDAQIPKPPNEPTPAPVVPSGGGGGGGGCFIEMLEPTVELFGQ